MQTRHSDHDLDIAILASPVLMYASIHFFPRTVHDWNSLDTLSRSKLSLLHSLQRTFPAANAMYRSSN